MGSVNTVKRKVNRGGWPGDQALRTCKRGRNWIVGRGGEVAAEGAASRAQIGKVGMEREKN